MRYFIGFLVTMGLIILLVILIFGGGGGDKAKVPTTSKPLDSYAQTDAEVSMDVSGPITSQSTHQGYRIIVDRDNVTFEETRGYEGSVVNLKKYSNNEAAYSNFLRALSRAGFTNGDNNKALQDETALCPLGSRYVFSLSQGGRDLERYWITSCEGTKTYLGNFSMTNSLFQLQVPDFSNLTQNFRADAS
jgi:hypothetical protein